MILLTALSAYTLTVNADNNIQQLEPMLITSESGTNLVEDPTKLVQNTIEKINYETVMQETNPGMKQPVIRGLMGDQVALSVDGIKFSNSLFRGGPNQYYSWIPDEFTTAASLNDSVNTMSNSALGGSVDRTLGVDRSQMGISTNFRGHTEYAKYKNTDWQTAVLNTDNDDVSTPNGIVPHSAYNQKGALLAHTNKDYGDTKLVFTRSDNVDRTDKFASGGFYQYDLQQYILASHKLWVNDRKIYIQPSFQRFEEKLDLNSPLAKNVDSSDNMYGINVGSFYDTQYGVLNYGVADSYEDINVVTGIKPAQYNYNTLTGFGVWDGNITPDDNYKLKYSYSLMDTSGNGLNRTLGNHAYGVNLKHVFAPENYSYFDFDVASKFPTINNLALARNDSVTELPNPNLKQERANTYTIGHQFHGLDISLFYKDLSDVIIRTQTDVPDGKGKFKWQYNNANTGHIAGVKLAYNRTFDTGTGVYMMTEYLDGRNDYDYWGKLTPLHSEIKLTQNVDWLFKDKLIAQWRYAPSVPTDRIALNDAIDVRIKNHNYGYNMLNLGYETTYDKQHKVSLLVNNVLNNTGRVYGSSVDFNERMLYLKYNYLF